MTRLTGSPCDEGRGLKDPRPFTAAAGRSFADLMGARAGTNRRAASFALRSACVMTFEERSRRGSTPSSASPPSGNDP